MNRCYQNLVVVLWLFCAPISANSTIQRLADQRNIIFDRIGSEQGLSQGIVTAIAQDLDGFVWVGTQEGLNRFDGYRFESYYRIEDDPFSLSHDYIRTILFDEEGTLWIGTDAGLNIFHPESKKFTRVALAGGSLEPVVYSLAQSLAGEIWLGTSSGVYVGISEFGFKNYWREPGDLDSIGPANVRTIELLESGDLWFGTEGSGIYSYDKSTGDIAPIDVNLPDYDVRDLLEDSLGRVWIATFNGGVTRFDPANNQTKTFLPSPKPNALHSNRVRALLEDHDGAIWFATDKGLHLWLGDDRFTSFELDPSNPRSISDNTILELFQDQGGVIWIGTFNGLNKWNAKVEMFPYFRRPSADQGQSSSNNITSFIESPDGDVWIGSFSGMMLWDAKLGTLVSIDPNIMGLKDPRVMSLGWNDGAIWVGTMTSGINVVENQKVTSIFSHDPTNSESISANAITRIYRDSRDDVWVATYGGGVNLFIGENRFKRFPEDSKTSMSFPDLRCLDIVEVPGGRYWIATQGGGVIILDPVTGLTETLRHDPEDKFSIPSNEVLTLLSTQDGVWIGTVNRGLSYFDFRTKKISRFSKKDGLASDAVYGLLRDDNGMIWTSGGKGLSVLDPKTRKFRLFDPTHGLQSSDFNSGAYTKLSDGSLVFGGNNGFNAFYPDRIRLNEFVPPVHIINFKLFNQKVQFEKPILEIEEIELSHDDSVLGIEFAALDYTAPKKNQYRYKLEGFDRDWVEHQGSREVTYTNLDAGSYVFRVQGSNNDGVWNEEGASLSLLVHPAPWLTWWAYGIYISLVVLAFYMLLRYNSERLRRDAERRYSERLQLYIESLEEASDSILIADSKGILMYANNTITDGLNRSPSEVIGESIWSVLFEEEKDVEAARNALRLEGRFHGEVELERISGERMTHEVTIAAVQQSSSNELAYVGISRDVTERKITEAELEDYRKNLERIVEERTEALQKEIAENKAIQVDLANSLNEKELLIKEVHHRVKNNMQVISSLLSIQAEGAEDEVYSDMLNESQQRIKSMALIHETLYQSKDLLRIDFQEYIETLTSSLSRSYSVPGVSVQVDVNVENVLLDLETAVPCGLVINELVSNSLKHAFHGKQGIGVIDIDFVTNDCSYDLRIADNGIGLPDDFDPTKSISMGMEIVSILTKQLEGELSSHNNNGAVFEIKFPRSVDVQ